MEWIWTHSLHSNVSKYSPPISVLYQGILYQGIGQKETGQFPRVLILPFALQYSVSCKQYLSSPFIAFKYRIKQRWFSLTAPYLAGTISFMCSCLSQTFLTNLQGYFRDILSIYGQASRCLYAERGPLYKQYSIRGLVWVYLCMDVKLLYVTLGFSNRYIIMIQSVIPTNLDYIEPLHTNSVNYLNLKFPQSISISEPNQKCAYSAMRVVIR